MFSSTEPITTPLQELFGDEKKGTPLWYDHNSSPLSYKEHAATLLNGEMHRLARSPQRWTAPSDSRGSGSADVLRGSPRTAVAGNRAGAGRKTRRRRHSDASKHTAEPENTSQFSQKHAEETGTPENPAITEGL